LIHFSVVLLANAAAIDRLPSTPILVTTSQAVNAQKTHSQSIQLRSIDANVVLRCKAAAIALPLSEPIHLFPNNGR
jgi:hypothetical protein